MEKHKSYHNQKLQHSTPEWAECLDIWAAEIAQSVEASFKCKNRTEKKNKKLEHNERSGNNLEHKLCAMKSCQLFLFWFIFGWLTQAQRRNANDPLMLMAR